ncbi:hypothetical protein [Rugosimonospora acidiphila]|uniref:hypothetical protein n=1 Tax=Rugosimonospora acidiphila TaxID=556531 RepID=UPI0031EEA3F4
MVAAYLVGVLGLDGGDGKARGVDGSSGLVTGSQQSPRALDPVVSDSAVAAPTVPDATVPDATVPDVTVPDPVVRDPATPGPDGAARVGRYVGQAQNAGLIGYVTLTIDSVDSDSGAAVGRIGWSGQLVGVGTLRGTVSASSARLNGVVDSPSGPWNTQVACQFVGGSGVNCDYTLQSAIADGRLPQRGSLTATRQ